MPNSIYEAIWGRTCAAFYDSSMATAENRGLRKFRQELLSKTTGRVVELGAGTGLNIAHYPPAVRELILTEPDKFMAMKLRKRVELESTHISIRQVSANELPFEDSSVDSVVSTLVLCSVPDPDATLKEVARVLRPDGKFFFIEHVRSEDPGLARWQDRFNKLWSLYAHGCNCNRDTIKAIERSPLNVSELRKESLHSILPLVRPLIVGQVSRDI